MRALVAYAAKLSALASQDDVTVADAVKGAMGAMTDAEWTSLKSDQNAAIAAFAAALTSALSARYRSGVLDDTIGSVDAKLQIVLKAMADDVDLRLKDIDGVTKQLDGAASVLSAAPDGSPAAQVRGSWGPGLYLLREHLVEARGRYIALKGALEAFASAHSALKKNAGKLDAKETVAEVVAVVKTAYAAANALAAKP